MWLILTKKTKIALLTFPFLTRFALFFIKIFLNRKMLGSLIPKANRLPPTTTTPPSMHFDAGSSGPWENAWMPQKTLGKCHGSHSKDRKDKYNDKYMGNTKRETDKYKNDGE